MLQLTFTWNGHPNDSLLGMLFYGSEIHCNDTTSTDPLFNYNLLSSISMWLDYEEVPYLLKQITIINLNDNYLKKTLRLLIKRSSGSILSVSSLLRTRLYLLDHPEEFKNYYIQYEHLHQIDTVSFPSYTNLDESLSSQEITFWIRRSIEKDDDYVEQIFKKIMNTIYPNYAHELETNVDTKMVNIAKSNIIIFAFDSYCDEIGMDIQMSILPCRRGLLLNNYFNFAKCDSNKTNEFTLSKGDTRLHLENIDCKKIFNEKNTYYALVGDTTTGLKWYCIKPTYTIDFKGIDMPCSSQENDYKNWGLFLTVGADGISKKPLLFAAFPDSLQKPSNAFLLCGKSNDQHKNTDSTDYILTTSYELPVECVQFKRLWKEDYYKWHEYGLQPNEKCHISATIRIEWANGDTQTVFQENGYGNYSFVDASISDLILSDIDGDGIFDLYLTASNNGKWVILFKNSQTIEKILIKNALEVETGGC